MRLTLRAFLLVPVLLLGCATQEYRQAENECTYDANRRFPINNVTQVVTVTRPIEVPTGQTNCVTNYFGLQATTTCQQVTRTEFRNFQEARVVDLNRDARKSAIDSCAAQTCMSRFGNPECKVNSKVVVADPMKQPNCVIEADALAKRGGEKWNGIYETCMSR